MRTGTGRRVHPSIEPSVHLASETEGPFESQDLP
jgi:hypothetical protein